MRHPGPRPGRVARPLVHVLGAIAAMVGHVRAVDYVLRDVPGCDDPGLSYVTSAAQCNAAAAAVGYGDTTASQGGDGGNTFPEGCYTRSNALYFNAGAASTNYALSTSRVSICVTGATESPTAAAEATGYVRVEDITCANAGFAGLTTIAECQRAAAGVNFPDTTATSYPSTRYSIGCWIGNNNGLYWNPTGSATPARLRDSLCRNTMAPTAAPTTSVPTAVPTTSAPTSAPTTSAPTSAPTRPPTTSVPTLSPDTSSPTTSPTTSTPTTSTPTVAPTVFRPVYTIATRPGGVAVTTTMSPPTSLRPTTAPTTTTPTFAGDTFAPTAAPTPGPTLAGQPCTSHNACDVADYCGLPSVCVSCVGCGTAAATPPFAGQLPCWAVCDPVIYSTPAAPGSSTSPPRSDGDASSDNDDGAGMVVIVLAVFAGLSLVICVVVVLVRTRNLTMDDGRGGRKPASFRKKVLASFTNIDFNADVNRWSAPPNEEAGYASIGDDHARINSMGRTTTVPPSRSVRKPGSESTSTFGFSGARSGEGSAAGATPKLFSYNPTYAEGEFRMNDYTQPATIDPEPVGAAMPPTVAQGATTAQYEYTDAPAAAEAEEIAPKRPKKKPKPKGPPRVVYNHTPPTAPPRTASGSYAMNPGFRDSIVASNQHSNQAMDSSNEAIYHQNADDETNEFGGLYEAPKLLASQNAAPMYEEPGSAPMYEAPSTAPTYDEPMAHDEPMYEEAETAFNRRS